MSSAATTTMTNLINKAVDPSTGTDAIGAIEQAFTELCRVLGVDPRAEAERLLDERASIDVYDIEGEAGARELHYLEFSCRRDGFPEAYAITEMNGCYVPIDEVRDGNAYDLAFGKYSPCFQQYQSDVDVWEHLRHYQSIVSDPTCRHLQLTAVCPDTPAGYYWSDSTAW